jgi:coiled-coil domain-containing protein 12
VAPWEARGGGTRVAAEGAAAAAAPRKANWDLKRDIAPRLGILERRTQRALVELLRERLERDAAAASAAQEAEGEGAGEAADQDDLD